MGDHWLKLPHYLNYILTLETEHKLKLAETQNTAQVRIHTKLFLITFDQLGVDTRGLVLYVFCLPQLPVRLIISIRFSFQLFPFSTGSDLVFTFQDFMSICLFPPRGFSCYLQLLILTQSFN